MPDPVKPSFLVDAYSDPVVIRIEGRASFQNCSSVQVFISELIGQGKSRFVMDFLTCTSMDSTFLGVLAGAALELRRQKPPGSLVLARVGPRNLELIRNLGLHHLLTIDAGENDLAQSTPSAVLPAARQLDELENARLVLAAHENLVSAEAANRDKFQDVLTFLKNRIAQG